MAEPTEPDEFSAPLIAVGNAVNWDDDEGRVLARECGAAIVLAIDIETAEANRGNRPAAWIRYLSAGGYARYRSVDLADLDLAQ